MPLDATDCTVFVAQIPDTTGSQWTTLSNKNIRRFRKHQKVKKHQMPLCFGDKRHIKATPDVLATMPWPKTSLPFQVPL